MIFHHFAQLFTDDPRGGFMRQADGSPLRPGMSQKRTPAAGGGQAPLRAPITQTTALQSRM
jgi:hypothetical protein